ncbi:MAG: hypothetical protein AAGA66_17615 [Bacteroidota bacterium]
MNRVNLKEQVFNLVALLVIQIPLLYRITLFDSAFAFFYVGFLIFLPFSLTRTYLLLIGFLSGLTIDVFSNTPGIHAFACVLIMYVRNNWLQLVYDDVDELININHVSLGATTLTVFVFPIIFLHHLTIFSLENGGFHLFGLLITKVFLSTIFSFIVIFILNYLIAPKARRI